MEGQHTESSSTLIRFARISLLVLSSTKSINVYPVLYNLVFIPYSLMRNLTLLTNFPFVATIL